jgi:hypothetical protein
MESKARQFLELTNGLYIANKKKWGKLVRDMGYTFDEDVYSDTIVKVYDHILNGDCVGDMEDYWFKSFITNIKREQGYSRNSKRDDIDVMSYLDKFENDIYSEADRELFVRMLCMVEKSFDIRSYHCFKLYYMLPEMTFEKVNELTGLKDSKARIMKIKEWLRKNVKQCS